MSQSAFCLNFGYSLGEEELPVETFCGFGQEQDWRTSDALWLSVSDRRVLDFGISREGRCEVQVSPDSFVPAETRYRRVGSRVVSGLSFCFDRVSWLYLSSRSRMRTRVVFRRGESLVEVSTWSLASLGIKNEGLHLIPFVGGEVLEIVDGVSGELEPSALSSYDFPLGSLVSLNVSAGWEGVAAR